MSVSFNKAACGVAAAMIAGGALLGMALYGGHVWQLATGGALLSAGTLGGVALFASAYFLRHKDEVIDALKNNSGVNIWSYAYDDKGNEVIVSKCADSRGNLKVQVLHTDIELLKSDCKTGTLNNQKAQEILDSVRATFKQVAVLFV